MVVQKRIIWRFRYCSGKLIVKLDLRFRVLGSKVDKQRGWLLRIVNPER